jgi:RNA exonuclease 4
LISPQILYEDKIRLPQSFKHLFTNHSNKNGFLLNAEQTKYISMDCEMVGVGENGIKSTLARVTIIDWNYKVLLETYVRPNEPVTDYRTAISGITEEHLYGKLYNVCDIATCQLMVKRIIHGKILVGHALENDLDCLGISHPWYMIRDTATYEPYMQLKQQLYTAEMNYRINKQKPLDSILFKYQPRKLKDLIYEKFSIDIQHGKHSSFEDAIAAFELYKLDQIRWEMIMSGTWNSYLFINFEATVHAKRNKHWCATNVSKINRVYHSKSSSSAAE